MKFNFFKTHFKTWQLFKDLWVPPPPPSPAKKKTNHNMHDHYPLGMLQLEVIPFI